MRSRSPLLASRRLLEGAMVERLALDDHDVFVARCAWATGPQLVAISHDGTRRRELVPEDGLRLGRIVADRRAIYAISETRLVRIRKTDGKVDELAQASIPFFDLTIDDEHVYASILGTYTKSYADGGIVRVLKRGGALEWVVPGKAAAAIALRDGMIVFGCLQELVCRDVTGEIRVLSRARNPHAIAFAGDDIIWTEFDSFGALAVIGRSGGERRALANETYTSGLVVIGAWIYWSQAASKRSAAAIWRTKQDGSGAPQPLVRFQAKAPALVGNARVLCWIDDCDYAVGALDLAQLPD